MFIHRERGCKNKCTIEPIVEPRRRTYYSAGYNNTSAAPHESGHISSIALSARLGLGNDTPLIERAVLITPPTTGTVPTQTTRPLAALLQQSEQLLKFDDFGNENIDYNKKDMFAPFRKDPQDDTGNLLDKIIISGSTEQQKRIRELCEKYRHIFKDELDATPATLTPFELDVDKKKWETYKNRVHVRV